MKKVVKTKYKKKIIPLRREPFNLNINLKDCYNVIRAKQEEIALAKRNGKDSILPELVKNLVKSYEARVVVVHQVVSNTGYRSPGLSKEGFRTNKDYAKMVDDLLTLVENPTSYKAAALDRIYLLKPNGKLRPISIPCYLDRALQALYKLGFEPITEETADLSSYGFRPVRNIYWAAGRVLNMLINPLVNYNYVVEVDISNYFPTIDHELIKSKTQSIIPPEIMEEWLKCGYVDRETNQEFETDVGVPQGGIISPTISNTVLDGLEDHIKNILSQGAEKGGGLARYADDIVIFTRSYDKAVIVKQAMKDYLQNLKLELSDEKTKITDMNHESFTFVGFDFRRIYRRNRKKLTASIQIPQKAISSYRTKISEICRTVKSLAKCIDDCNAIIRGWGYNYRFAHDFRYVSRGLQYWTWKQIYAKAYRIHLSGHDKANHTETHEAVMSKYFGHHETYETWPIVVDSKRKVHTLAVLRDIESKNPTYTNKAKNAFIAEDRMVLEKAAIRMAPGIRSEVLENWSCCCGLCGRSISLFKVPYELHHIRPRLYGGTNKPKNLVPLCREPCHMEVTKAVASRNFTEIGRFIDANILDIPPEVLQNMPVAK